MADSQVTTLHGHFFVVLCLMASVLHISPAHAGCTRTRCSGTAALRQELRRTVDFLSASSDLLARLTYRAINYTNFEYNIMDSCNPTCSNSLANVVMQETWSNASRNEILEFHRRVSLGFSQLVTKSLADLSRAQNVTTTQTYLISVRDMVGTIKRLVTRAVKIDRKLNGLTPLNIATGQQSSSTAMPNTTVTSTARPQSVSTVVCHFSRCVLYKLLIESYRMIRDFLKIKNSL